MTFSLNPLPSDMPVSREGFVLLGCPIGSSTYCASIVLRRVKKVQELLHLLPDLEDSSDGSHFLEVMFGSP